MENIDKVISILNESLVEILDKKSNVTEELVLKTKNLYVKLYKQLRVDFESDDFFDFYSLDHYDKIINLIVDNSDILKNILNLDETSLSFLLEVIKLINNKKRERYELDQNDEYASRGFSR